jgi:acyl-CoA hydrolase
VSPKSLSPGDLLDAIAPGSTIYIPGSVAEISFLHAALSAEPDRLRDVMIVSCLIPGLNSFDYAGLHPTTKVTTFLFPPALRPSFEAGRVRVLPLQYTNIAAYLADLAPDVAILHLTPPANGRCSFGVCADFGPIVAGRAKRRIGVINPNLPRPLIGPTIAFEDLDAVVELPAPPLIHAETEPGADLVALASKVAALIPDGAVVQSGIGAAPTALWRALESHRGLRVHSGMITEGVLRAYDAGALVASGHIAGFASGGAEFLARFDGWDAFEFADARITHGADSLARIDSLYGVNSGLEVDLFGQANIEWQGDRLISGVGGAPDFARAAPKTGGRSILALPSTARGGSISRISLKLGGPAVSLGRSEVDTVVTEYGVAELRWRSLDERAEALIAIAAPQHQAALAEGWTETRKRL